MVMRIRLVLAAVLAVALSQTTASAVVIFDNSNTTDNGITTTGAPQLGGEVTAAGTARTVTELDLGFTSQGIPASADIQAFLYANDGVNGAPGTLLWQSAVMSGVNFNSVNTLVAFSVPSIVVPDTFTFTGAITNESGVVGFVPESGATVGTFVTPWVGSPAGWSPLDPVFEIEARVIAGTATVPEPSTFVLLGIGLAGFVVVKRHQRAVAA